MIECSVTVTCGVGSERHNHDAEYRSKMEHIVSGPEDIIELIPYIPYNARINEIMGPYIKQYNNRRDERFADAMDRYQQGQLKRKPSRKNYAHMDYDYASTRATSDHRHQNTGRVEKDPIYRSIILGLGDRKDRLKISREQAIAVFRAVATVFPTVFPFFLLLGFTLHLDEEGFYHAHLDYFIACEKSEWTHDLPIYRGQDRALKLMGFNPEQSIITSAEKQPLYFNALRNRLYKIMEHAMDEQGLRLQYGVSQAKYPYKDPSKNMRLEHWQDAQDRFCALQHHRNQAVELLCRPNMQVRDIQSSAAIIHTIQDLVEGKTDLAPITLLHGYQVTSELLDRYTAAATHIVDVMLAQIQAQQQQLNALSHSISTLETQRQHLYKEIQELQSKKEDQVKTVTANTAASPVPQETREREAHAEKKSDKAMSMSEWMDLIQRERNSNKGSTAAHQTIRTPHTKNRDRR